MKHHPRSSEAVDIPSSLNPLILQMTHMLLFSWFPNISRRKLAGLQVRARIIWWTKGQARPAPPHTKNGYSVHVRHHSTASMKSTDSVLAGKYPAKAHAANIASYLQRTHASAANGLIYLEGQKTRMIEDNDEPQPFR